MSEYYKGFTIVSNKLIEKLGLTAAAIYGEMWRYAQQSELKICTASQSKIGSRIQVSRETVNRNIPKLIENECIKESGRSSGCITYAVLIDLRPYIGLQDDVTENHKGCEEKSQEGVRESHTKKGIKKDIKKKEKKEKKKKKTPEEILGPEILERTKKMRENSGKESLSAEELKKAAYGLGKEKDPLEGYPPAHKDLLEVFCEHFEYPFPDQKKAWIKQVEVWVNRGYTPEDVEKACLYVESKDGWDVYQPSSILKAFGKEIGDGKNDPAHTLDW